jgi:hypothetical protein
MTEGPGGPEEVRTPAGFTQFVAARSPALLSTAWLLTGDRGCVGRVDLPT